MHTSLTPSWIELSASAFAHNISVYKNIAGQPCDIALVIKSNAYGHGLQEMGALAQSNEHISWLCTTSLSEALQLREHGITKPILVMAVLDSDLAQAIDHDIDVVAYDSAMLKELNELGKKLNKRAAIHIKIDTGLSRLGVTPQAAHALIDIARTLPFINVRGIYTHFAEADNEDQSFTQHQMDQFSDLLRTLHTRNITIPVRHAGNSAACVLLPMDTCSMVRLGGGAYGLNPFTASNPLIAVQCPKFALKQVMAWKTRIMQLRTIEAGCPISYARTFVTEKPTLVGVVPVGYYEGYDRRFSNCGTMMVYSQATGSYHRAPVLGRICMNMTMLDVSGVPGVALKDEVIITGDMPGMHARELADIIASHNPREITTRINPLIPRMIVP